MGIKFQSDKLYEACEILKPVLNRLVLVGGWALRVQMNLNDTSQYRETKDIDYAIQMIFEEDFKNVFELLEPKGFKNYVDSIQYTSNDEYIIIHLMPFGKVEEGINTKEYYLLQESNETIEVLKEAKPTHAIKCADIVAVVVMKIFSFNDHLNDFLLDNHRSRKKDLFDLIFVLSNYKDDTYDEIYSAIRTDKLNEMVVYEHFKSAHIIGKKVKRLIKHTIIVQAKDKLHEIVINEGVRAKISGDDISRLEILLDYFKGLYE